LQLARVFEVVSLLKIFASEISLSAQFVNTTLRNQSRSP